MLEWAASELTSVNVLPLVVFTVKEWQEQPKVIENSVFAEAWSRKPLIVRSSALMEDKVHMSAAGKFSSVLNVVGKREFRAAVEKVWSSYGDDSTDLDEVFVQPMVINSVCSGAATSVDITSGGRYRVISWSEGVLTNVVTGGYTDKHNTWIGLPNEACSSHLNLISKIQICIAEIEYKMGLEIFEIEFCLQKNTTLTLFQLRELNSKIEKLHAFEKKIETVQQSVISSAYRNTRILGSGVLLGAMSDWNPAELIGFRPKPLSRSLYEFLITSNAWSDRRAKYGYRDLSKISLMLNLAGHAFVDVRASLTSLIPANIPENVATRLLEAYCARLRDDPKLHDKIEFDIAVTCMSFNTNKRLAKYEKFGLSKEDIACTASALTTLTQRLCCSKLVDDEYANVDQMITRRETGKDLNPIDQAEKLLNDALCFGTRPFGGLARLAFIATDILRSAQSQGILYDSFIDEFFSQLYLPTTAIQNDLETLPFTIFLQRYGHLRPSTYDIRNKRYDEAPEYYFTRMTQTRSNKRLFKLDHKTEKSLTSAFSEIGLSLNANDFLNFTRKAIESREWMKFEFSRNISNALKLVTEWGTSLGFTRNDLANLEWDNIQQASEMKKGEAREFLCKQLNQNRLLIDNQLSITFPVLIKQASDCRAFQVIPDIPNFVTQLRVVAQTALIDNGDDPDDAIVMITNADPGYDWIFSRDILGLVTAFGGVNSHMAVRAQEAGIPAAIGCGLNDFKRLTKFQVIELDAGALSIRGVS